MFAVIYQGYVKAGRESEYQKSWNMVARYFVEQRGAIGSCLHRDTLHEKYDAYTITAL